MVNTTNIIGRILGDRKSKNYEDVVVMPGHKRRKTRRTVEDDDSGRTVSFSAENYKREKR